MPVLSKIDYLLRTRLGIQAHHPIRQQQGRLGHAYLDRVFVLRPELRTKHIRNATSGVNFQIAAGKRRALRLRLFRQ